MDKYRNSICRKDFLEGNLVVAGPFVVRKEGEELDKRENRDGTFLEVFPVACDDGIRP